ncbi:hypothetical protein [Acidovorax sp. Leaf78]|uniref:hypothetical protein n=1 Tax=Acidovorax sp. Leaf78 TaxID=1736237 RepID=UPI0006F84659|nr:hypothetical protein [Acidovorax sp. Leaf78]KQO15913.1 hypothetical protein ASF16_14955 [Acidovorax sp. Leaf78]RYH31960.1 MAG: hypothetical protein EON54_21055 [Alcaligenaceae bacterium]
MHSTTMLQTKSPMYGAAPERLVHDKPIPLRLTQSERDEALQMADEDSRSASSFALHVYRLGLVEHKRRRAAMSAHA